eukprot:TRINITY_DN3764_c0_g1_i2.p1 TRINITY_DN3764_c0_g1~~TRINITY_DN3764_c0_g1_i2.p1  ORF type:complete len:598 (-),score=108.83 TRINITY_DN3764_c0_g1_i2:27-1820(-)
MSKEKPKDETNFNLSSNTFHQLFKIFQLLSPDYLFIILGVFCSLGETWTIFLENTLAGEIIDVISGGDQEMNVGELNYYALLLFVCYGVQCVLAFFGEYLFGESASRLSTRVKHGLFGAIVDHETRFFDENQTGSLTSRLGNDVKNLSVVVTNLIPHGLYHVIKLLGTVIYMFYLSYKLSGAIICCIPLMGISYIFQGNSERKLYSEVSDLESVANQTATESIGEIRTVKSFTQEKYVKTLYGKQLENIASVFRKIVYRKALINASTYLSFNMSIAVGMWYGGTLVLSGDITSGQLITYTLLAISLNEDLSAIPELITYVAKAVSSSERIFEIIESSDEVQNPNLVELKSVQGEIIFDKVKFSYPSRPDEEILHSLSLNVSPGETIALIGQSGSGKSTILKLVQKMYEITDGRIMLDGYDIKELDTHWLRRNIGIVNQEPVLFSLSVRDNINYGHPNPEEISEADTIKAAKQANAHDFIIDLEDGYDTLCGERGNLLSAGQKQRIAIARAIMMNPSILFLDEATSALDNESEKLVQEAINRLIRGRSCIIIAHRLSTIRNVDQIYVIKQGQIVEHGNHEELIKIDGEYLNLLSGNLL